MAPRVLRKGPDYTLDIKTRVPTGSLQRTQQPNLTPAPDTSLSETFGFLGDLARIGYSLKGFFNQNNQSNSVKGWNDMFPEVQGYYNSIPTDDPANLEELNKEAISKYSDHIQSLDYNKKVKAKMVESLNSYAKSKMEQFWAKSISENEIGNITNLDTEIDVLVKAEDINGALRLITKASGILSDGMGGFGIDETVEDTWLNDKLAQARWTKVINEGNFEIAKNDMLELDYKTAYDILTTQAEDENGNLYYPRNPEYPELSELTGEERIILEKTIAQAGTLEEKRKSIAEFEASNAALNSLFSDEINVADFMKSENPDLDIGDRIQIVNAYEAQQKLEVARLDSIAAEPIRKGINDGTITNPDTIRAINDPDLTETTRAELIRSLISGTKSVDPYKESLQASQIRLDYLMRKAANGDDVLNILRSGLRLTKDTGNGTRPPLLHAIHYNKLLEDVQNKSGLQKLTSIVSGASRDPRFIDKTTKLQDSAMFDEFVRTYTDLFYNQINEQDPEKQMNIDQFRQMADTLIDTIKNEKLQKEFRNISESNKNVGTGLLTSFRFPFTQNDMEVAVNSLNEGMYDAMKYIEPEAWSKFKRKMIDQWELIKGETYNEELRLYKDKIPVFLNKDGIEEMIIIENNIPQLVSLEIGIDKHKNLALGYNVGDTNPEDETMLTTGWFRITEDSVDTFGSAFGGQIIRPKGKEEYYLMTDTLRGVVVRPYHGNPNSESEIAAAVKDVTSPVIELDEESSELKDVDDAIKTSTPRSYYQGGFSNPADTPEIQLTPRQRAEIIRSGRP